LPLYLFPGAPYNGPATESGGIDMTLEQLRIFVAVAEREHMTRAAEAIHITQSAASAAIAALEARYNTRLFHRIGRRIELTDAGRLFLSEARAVLARSAAAERVLHDLAGCMAGTLSLFASQTIANYWLPPLLHRFRVAYPGVSVQLAIGNTEEVAAAVSEGFADIGFAEGNIDNPALRLKAVKGDRLVVVVSPRHEWSGRNVAAEDLMQGPWVMREPGSGTRAIFLDALRGLGVEATSLKVAMELPSNEAVCAAVRAGAGAAAISDLVAEPLLSAGTLALVSLPLPERPFYVARHKERSISRAERALLDLVE
jgi:DNA-binding transcriptional LysR family regulator